jgi:hypothetical protein
MEQQKELFLLCAQKTPFWLYLNPDNARFFAFFSLISVSAMSSVVKVQSTLLTFASAMSELTLLICPRDQRGASSGRGRLL